MPATRPISRRGVLAVTGLSAGVTALTGCEPVATNPPSATATPSPRPTPGRITETASPSTPEELDLPVAFTMLKTCTVALATTVRTARRHPGLAAALAPTEAVHRAHVELLEGAAGAYDTPPLPPVPVRAAAAWADVLRGERRLQEALRGGALRAQSGALARALASMSAAVAQQLVRLPESPPEGRR